MAGEEGKRQGKTGEKRGLILSQTTGSREPGSLWREENQGDQLDREKLEKVGNGKGRSKEQKDHKAQDTREVWARSINQCANPSTRSSVKPSINSPVHQPINRPLRGGEALLGSTIGKESQRDGREEEKEREGEGGEGRDRVGTGGALSEGNDGKNEWSGRSAISPHGQC